MPEAQGVKAPVDVQRKPAGQAVQVVTEELEKVPGVQGTGATVGSAQEWPLGQGEHELLPGAVW